MSISFQVAGLPTGADPRLVVVHMPDGSWVLYDCSTGGIVDMTKPGKGFTIYSQGSTLAIQVERETSEEKMMYWLGLIKNQPEKVIERIPKDLLRRLPPGLLFPVHVVALNIKELTVIDINKIQEELHPISREWGVDEEFEDALMLGGEDFVYSPGAKRVAVFASEVRQVWLEALNRAKQ